MDKNISQEVYKIIINSYQFEKSNKKTIIIINLKIMRNIIYYILLILASIKDVLAFQFMTPQVNCQVCTINTVTTYNIDLTRKYSPSLSDTPWNTQAVPANSNITIVFPVQYTLTGTQSCDSLTILSSFVSGYNCLVNITAKSITITGAITANMFIDTINVNILNVQNPSPAITTSPFTAQIGIDTSSNDSLGVVALQPGSFQNVTVTFDPTTVNTTGNMLITAVLGNSIPANGTIVVIFPNNLRWTQQISLTNLLPIRSSMQCSSLNANIRYTLSCSGDTSTKAVTITNAFSTNLAAGSVIAFTINSIFSPPTTQALDTVIVETYNNGFGVDQSTPKITGLTPKSISLAIGSTSSLIINSAVGLQFNFSLTDTISKVDYVVIEFPSGTNFTYQTYICPQLNFSNNFSYVSSTGMFTMYQSSTSLNRNSGTSISLTIRSFTCPSSARNFGPIYLHMMNGNGQKMLGSNNITILPKAYTATMTTGNTTINSLTSYTISFQMSDQISSTGYYIVKFPAEIINSGSIDILITGTSIKSIPANQYINSSTIKLSSLNLSSSNIPAQNISIKINGLIQPGSVKNISSFIVQIYFSSANDLVSQATTSTIITATPGNIISSTVTPTSTTTASTTTYTIQVRIANPLNNGSQLMLYLPSTVSLITGGVCTVQSVTSSCTVNSNSISFNLATSYTSGSTITLSYTNFINPSSTRPTSTFGITTFNSALETVDILPASLLLTVTMVNPSLLLSTSVTRSSVQNRFITTYTFFFTQSQIINQSVAIASFVFPSSYVIANNITCTSGSTTLTCTVSSNTINIQFIPTQQNSTVYNFTINGIQNPISLKPSTSISITTRTQDLLYQYSAVSAGLQQTNTIASAFTALTYLFTNQVLSEQSSLVMNITMADSPAYLLIQYAPSFLVGNGTLISCSASSFTALCSLTLNNATGLYQTKVQSTSSIPTSLFTLNVSTLNNPSTIPNDYSWVSSFTSDDYLISQNKNTIQFTTFCTFPCRLCNTTTRSVCTSCYSTNVTNKIYLFQQQCLSTCPDGYVENNNTYTCQPCNLPCLTCLTTKDYCATCNTSTAFKYLNKTTTTSTCLSECVPYMYPDTTQIPIVCVNCVSPCSTCTTRTSCLSCVSGYFSYSTQCLTSCPADVTILINTTCYNCSSSCATCSNSVSNCTYCTPPLSLYNNTCIAACPGNLITINNVCTSCSSSCLTCLVIITNCTSCVTGNNSQAPYFYNYTCLNVCPNFYYPNTFLACLSCQQLNRGCKNCSSPTACLSCDPGFVLLGYNCLSTVPDGYLNISGIAVPCEGDCQTCSLTLTNCTSCRTLNLYENHCISACPTGTVALNKTCRACTYPCTQCINSTTICTQCASNSSLYLYNHSCIAAASCPGQTYPQDATRECTNCTQPCNLCNSSTICVSCINGYFYINSSFSCQTTCPPFSVGINRVCQGCLSPCQTCVSTTIKCITCVANYYYNPLTFECLTTCPIGKIANQSTMQCVNCQSPCKTCINTTDTCLSCVLGTFLSNNLCIKVCPQGQYGVSGLCKNCQNNCTTCSSAVNCLSCSVPLVLYSGQCLSSCPVTHSIVSNDSVCISCTTVVSGCSNCSKDGECYSCFSPLIYYNTTCLSSCPQGYKYQNFTCVLKNSTDIILDESLQSYTFPIPFTILGCVLFVACCMSKLQNSNTYLIGLLYSLFGLVQTGSFGYLIYQYYMLGSLIYDQNSLYIMFAVAGCIYLINIISLIVQSVYLGSFDNRFKHWLNAQNKCPFTFVSIVSLLINYKFKMVLFSKLFRFYSMSAILEKLSRFRLFNIFSFFGILPEALALYVCFVSIVNYTFQKLIFHAFLDVIVIFMINILLAVLIVWKPDNFFHEDTEEGFAVNKVITANGDDFSKQAILGHEEQVENHQYGPDSYLILSKSPLADVSQASNQYSSTLSQKKDKVRVYFSNQELGSINQSSNPFRKEMKKDSIQKISPHENIFGEISQKNDQYSENDASNLEQDQHESQIGGSQNINEKLSPKSPRKHATVVVGTAQHIKTNNATENQDVGKRISQREKQLDEIKKQLQQKQQMRKQKRKSRKKLKKSIEINLDSKQPEYEAITIKDQTQKMHTEQDSNMKTMQEPKNVHLHAQSKQTNVEEDFKDQAPKETLGSWRQLRIAEQNRKLPVFNPNNQEGDINTISLPQSQHEQYEQQQKNVPVKKQTAQLASENNVIGVQKDLESLQKKQEKKKQQIRKKEIERQQKMHPYNYQEQRSKDFSNTELQNSSFDIIGKKILKKNSVNLNLQENDPSHTRNSLQVKQYTYQQRFSNSIKDQDQDPEQDQSQNQILKQDSKYLYLQENSKDYDQRAGTRLNFKNIEKKSSEFDEQLQESNHEDEKINERPYTASRKNKVKNSQALLQILAKSEREKMNSKGAGVHKITREDKSVEKKNFRLSGVPQKSQSRQDGSIDEQQRKSRMYKAGLSQFQRQKQSQDRLNRKKTMNYPLNSLKKKTEQDPNDLSSSFNQIQNSRNKSFNVGSQFRKFNSTENIDDLGLDYVDYKKNYEDLMNQRYQMLPGSQKNSGQINFRGNSLPKPIGHNSPFRRSNFNQNSSQERVGGLEDSELDQYYKRQQKSLQKRQRQKKQKNRSLTKQKTFEETKRIKELQRIYLARK